jgi:hypothetical protein
MEHHEARGTVDSRLALPAGKPRREPTAELYIVAGLEVAKAARPGDGPGPPTTQKTGRERSAQQQNDRKPSRAFRCGSERKPSGQTDDAGQQDPVDDRQRAGC